MPRHCNDEVARERRRAALDDEVLIAGLKKAWSMGEVRLDPDNFTQKHPADPERQAGTADRMIGIDKRGVAAERHPERRFDLPFGRRVRRHE